ncbi:hypothetical protein H6G80_01040 [Nostoc sp. FACHB-87]|uniref:hypothetical protein n=1 Tax=Nostocaceae TaxID=1162 RepID=UPI0016842870|nr:MULTISPECIES: hypothetical protein [Nostocaceae]MBD2452686.1 hypothetical protein [Nostoc sp. FACHB-87]MBD2473617.1 hypothetical protein [Anabaena sp. FACHB-83]
MRVFAYLNVDDPWIAWLVYRGEIVSTQAIGQKAISVWHTKYLLDAATENKRATYYKTELVIEQIRQDSFSDKVSRLSGLYFFDSIESAMSAGKRWDGNFKEEYLAEIEIYQCYHSSRHDSEWITYYMNHTDRSWILKYLSGEPLGQQPLWELLVEGRGFVLGTQVRQRAYETVKRKWPKSLGLLELSRIAVELSSDLGFICPLLTVNDSIADLRIYLNFQDANNPIFLDKLSKYEGAKNTADLNSQTDCLVVPDLSEYYAQFRL